MCRPVLEVKSRRFAQQIPLDLQLNASACSDVPDPPAPPSRPCPEGQGPPGGGDIWQDDGTLLQVLHGQDGRREDDHLQGHSWIVYKNASN